jgi:hypothetical protein
MLSDLFVAVQVYVLTLYVVYLQRSKGRVSRQELSQESNTKDWRFVSMKQISEMQSQMNNLIIKFISKFSSHSNKEERTFCIK